MKFSMAACLVALGLAVCARPVVAKQALPLVREVTFLPLQASDSPSVIIPRVTGAVVVDGKLDDPDWKTAEVVDHFLLYPTKTPDPRRARAMLMYDNENLYLGMEMYGDDNGHLRLVDQKEPDVWGGHMVEVWLATSARADDVFHLCLNARGSRYDETLKQGPSWQGRWQGKGTVQADRWTAEIAFPFTEVHLSSPPTGGPWLVNFARTGERDASWTGVWEDAPRFGRLFFGADPGTGRSPAIEMILDREEYDPLDVTGVALVKVERGHESLASLKVQLEVIDKDKRVLHSFRVDRLLKEGLDLTLDMTGIPPGVYRLKASLFGPQDNVLATAEGPLRKLVKRKQLPEPERGRIPLHVWKAETDQTDPWPITTGVPFPQGVLPSADHVRLLDDRGREVPCQTAVRSEWNRHGSVRWLGLDFPGRLTARGTNYTLEYGGKVRPRKTRTALAIEERGNDIRVNTGPLSFLVRKRGFNLVDEVKLNGELLVRQEAGSGLELVDHEGATYTAANDPDTQVTLEERGPVKVVLRAEGWYVKDGTKGARVSPTLPTDRLCQHITRITAYAGQPYVRVQHVWIVTFDTSKVRLRNVGIGLNVPGGREAVFGLDAQPRTLPFPLPTSVRLYQPSSEKAVVETDGEQEGTYRTLSAGRRSDGWFTVKGTKGGVALSVQDLWQAYPKELEVSHGKMWLHLWPRHGRPYTGINPLEAAEIYKLWWCHQGRELNFQMPGEVFQTLTESDFGKAAGCAENFENGRIANAQGVASETNFLLYFHSAKTLVSQCQQVNSNFQLQPHAYADPQWVCDSLVFGPMTPKDPVRFPDVERYFEHNVMLRVAAQEYARDYGMWNFFDFHSDNSSFVNGSWGLNRVWNNGHHGTARLPWYLYVRSGDPQYLQLARRSARHVMNVDVVHYVTPNHDLFADFKRPSWPNLDHTRGAMYHVKGFQHWGGDSVVAGHLINYDFMLWDYYLNGNHRALEVAKEWSEGIKKLAPHGYEGREGTMTLAELVEMYKATWDVGLLDIMDAFQKRIAAQPFDGQGWTDYAPFLERYLSFSGSDTYRKRALEWKDKSPNVAATLYYETHDTAKLREIAPSVAFEAIRYDTDDHTITPDMVIPAWYNITYNVQYWQPYLRALLDAGMDLTLGPQAEQWMPQGSVVFLRKDKPGPLPLRFDWFARAKEPIAVAVSGPDGKLRLTKTLGERENPGDASVESLPDEAATGLYRVEVNLPDYRYGLRASLSDLPTVFVISAGSIARFFDPQIWYFRTAKDQTMVELNLIFVGREAGFHLRTADGRKSLASRARPGMLRAEVQPDTVYSLLTVQSGSNANMVIPVGRPLVLAMKPEHLFEVPER